MGNALGYLKWMWSYNQAFAPDRHEDFVETNIGFPCRVVTGNKAVQSVFDIDLFRKEEFCFGPVEVRKDFTDGVCPSITSNGKIHERKKALMMDVISEAYKEIPASTADAVLSSIASWGIVGMAANLVASFARLDTIRAEDREELREEALAALKKHGGLTGGALAEMPKIESFVLEVLRACPSPDFWSTIATRPATVQYSTESGPQEVEIKAGERVYASSYWALRDPAVFDKPDDFVWRRFLGPEGRCRRRRILPKASRLLSLLRTLRSRLQNVIYKKTTRRTSSAI
uniref:Cytochrome P450 n=1 Tax=Branchiostoma floridae TaxID=7739 RepID=C3YV34_BRAFL|eukprot:XP_002599885.1 hypothetical protein BRAFLDRAFT_95575 [Branchiostoma floridae]